MVGIALPSRFVGFLINKVDRELQKVKESNNLFVLAPGPVDFDEIAKATVLRLLLPTESKYTSMPARTLLNEDKNK